MLSSVVKPNFECSLDATYWAKQIKQLFSAVIFDMDGTIVDSLPLWQEAEAEVLVQLGVPAECAILAWTKHYASIWEMIHYCKQEFGVDIEVEPYTRQVVALARMKMQDRAMFIPGFPDFLIELKRAGVKVALATNTDKETIAILDQSLNLTGLFDSHIYCAEDVNYNVKPKPDLFLLAADKLGVSPAQCLIFEDSSSGVTAAKAAGAGFVVAIQNDFNDHAVQHLADGSIPHYDDTHENLLQLLGVALERLPNLQL